MLEGHFATPHQLQQAVTTTSSTAQLLHLPPFSYCHGNNTLLFSKPSETITMSAESTPITPARFAAALTDLPISSLYAKHAELTNNIVHLESSNRQLEDFARENDDRDCYEALLENRQVIKNFNERMDLIKREVEEVRGLPWRPRDEGEVRKEEGAIGLNSTTVMQNGTSTAAPGGPQAAQEQRNGVGEQNGEDEEGVYL